MILKQFEDNFHCIDPVRSVDPDSKVVHDSYRAEPYVVHSVPRDDHHHHHHHGRAAAREDLGGAGR